MEKSFQNEIFFKKKHFGYLNGKRIRILIWTHVHWTNWLSYDPIISCNTDPMYVYVPNTVTEIKTTCCQSNAGRKGKTQIRSCSCIIVFYDVAENTKYVVFFFCGLGSLLPHHWVALVRWEQPKQRVVKANAKKSLHHWRLKKKKKRDVKSKRHRKKKRWQLKGRWNRKTRAFVTHCIRRLHRCPAN